MKWFKIGLFVATVVSGIVGTWFGARYMERNAQKAQQAATVALLAEQEADRLLSVRDSFTVVLDSVTQRAVQAEARAQRTRLAIPPRPPTTPGCSLCEARASALEEALEAEQASSALKDTVIRELRGALAVVNLAADTLRLSLAAARAELQRQGAVLVRPKSKINIALTAGYSAILSPEGGKFTVRHGPGATLGIRIPLNLPF